MKKIKIFATLACVCAGLALVSHMLFPASKAQPSAPTADSVGTLSEAPSYLEGTFMVGKVLVFDMVEQMVFETSYEYPEGSPEPDSIDVGLMTQVNDYSYVPEMHTIKNVAPNIYIWDGKQFIPAVSAKCDVTEMHSIKGEERVEKWIFTTKTGKTYRHTKKYPED